MSARIPFPPTPDEGEFFTDAQGQRWQWSSFKHRWSFKPLPAISQAYTESATPPENKVLGWYDTTDGTVSFWDTVNQVWVVSSGPGGVGVDGEDGDAGIQGIQGERGIQGIQGVQGVAGTQGVQGEDGTPGTIMTFKGSQANLAAIEALDTPTLNDAWLAVDSGFLYIYDGSAWVSLGDIQGPQGIQGIQGVQGVQGETGPIVRDVVTDATEAISCTKATHGDAYVRLTGAEVTITLPTEAAQDWDVGNNITFRIAAGAVIPITFNPVSPVVINGSDKASSLVEDDTFILMYLGGNVWDYI